MNSPESKNFEGKMEEENRDQIIINRHEQRVNTDTAKKDWPKEGDYEHPDYPGITKSGVEHGTEITKKEILEFVMDADPDAIIFFGGASEEIRTKSTTKLRGDVLAQEFKDDDNVLVYTQEDIEKIRQSTKKEGSTLKKIQEIIDNNKNKKLIFTFPLALKNVSLRPQFRNKQTGMRTRFAHLLNNQSEENPDKAVELWLENEGQLNDNGEIVKGHKTPQKTAEDHLHDLQRLRSFAKKFTGDRQLFIGSTTHNWNGDSLMVYLANKGKVDKDGYEKLKNDGIKQGETARIEFKGNKAVFHYRNQEFEIPEEKI